MSLLKACGIVFGLCVATMQNDRPPFCTIWSEQSQNSFFCLLSILATAEPIYQRRRQSESNRYVTTQSRFLFFDSFSDDPTSPPATNCGSKIAIFTAPEAELCCWKPRLINTSIRLINSCKIIEKSKLLYHSCDLPLSDYMRFISKIYNQIILVIWFHWSGARKRTKTRCA